MQNSVGRPAVIDNKRGRCTCFRGRAVQTLEAIVHLFRRVEMSHTAFQIQPPTRTAWRRWLRGRWGRLATAWSGQWRRRRAVEAAAATTGLDTAATATVAAEATTLALQPGQQQLLWLARGAVLHLHRGRLEGQDPPRFSWLPAWADGSASDWTLRSGEVRVMAQSGWVCLTASQASPGRCELSARPPAAPRSRLPRRC
jgi:hypothetical protein